MAHVHSGSVHGADVRSPRAAAPARIAGPERPRGWRATAGWITANGPGRSSGRSTPSGSWLARSRKRREESGPTRLSGASPFEEWASEWLALQAALKPKTRAGYEGILRTHILPVFGSRQLVSIEPVHVRRFVADLTASGSAPRTVRNAYRVLSAAMRSAVEARRIVRNPCQGVSVPRAQPRQMLFLSVPEVVCLAEAAGEWGTLVYFAAYSGMRWGEIAALRAGRVHALRSTVDVMESVSEVGGEVLFVAPKTGRSRTLTVPRFVMGLWAPLLADKAPEDLVFASRDGRPLRHGQFYRYVFRPAAKAAGLPEGLRMHDMRHSAAALAIAEGAHPRTIMERLGHSSIVVTMDVYGHLFESADEALAEGLDAAHRRAVAGLPRDHDGTVIPLRASDQWK